jgi:hypothetical protein
VRIQRADPSQGTPRHAKHDVCFVTLSKLVTACAQKSVQSMQAARRGVAIAH